MQAIEEEMAEYKKHGVYKKMPVKDCWNKTGKKLIRVRGVIVNKGDGVSTDYRARLIATQIQSCREIGTVCCDASA